MSFTWTIVLAVLDPDFRHGLGDPIQGFIIRIKDVTKPVSDLFKKLEGNSLLFVYRH